MSGDITRIIVYLNWEIIGPVLLLGNVITARVFSLNKAALRSLYKFNWWLATASLLNKIMIEVNVRFPSKFRNFQIKLYRMGQRSKYFINKPRCTIITYFFEPSPNLTDGCCISSISHQLWHIVTYSRGIDGANQLSYSILMYNVCNALHSVWPSSSSSYTIWEEDDSD